LVVAVGVGLFFLDSDPIMGFAFGSDGNTVANAENCASWCPKVVYLPLDDKPFDDEGSANDSSSWNDAIVDFTTFSVGNYTRAYPMSATKTPCEDIGLERITDAATCAAAAAALGYNSWQSEACPVYAHDDHPGPSCLIGTPYSTYGVYLWVNSMTSEVPHLVQPATDQPWTALCTRKGDEVVESDPVQRIPEASDESSWTVDAKDESIQTVTGSATIASGQRATGPTIDAAPLLLVAAWWFVCGPE
jgi:hypothetical protein